MDLIIPHYAIQSDWEDSLGSSGGGRCWVSVRNFGQEKSIQGELSRSGSAETLGDGHFGVETKKSGGRFLTVKQVESGSECVFVATSTAFHGIHKGGVISMDVSEGGLGVSLCKNNELKIWETDTGNVRRILQGHLIDAYSCRFFPSGLVILSGGTDCCLKIFSAETGECPVILRGHTGSVMDTCIVDRGRNVISVSKDGSARLWDCGEAKCLATLFSCGSVINSCIIITTNYELGPPTENMSHREVMTGGKLLILGREDSKVTGVHVAGRKDLFTCVCPSAVNCVVQIESNEFAAGCQGGEILLFRLSTTMSQPQPFTILSSTTSPILDLLVHPSLQKAADNDVFSSFWASKADGTTVLINPAIQPCTKVVELTGPNCDAVYQLKSDLDFIYTACRDGLIRKYSLKVINRLV